MRESILILGGGVDQIEAVHVVNKLGFLSVCVDKNIDSVCAEFCDYFINISNRIFT